MEIIDISLPIHEKMLVYRDQPEKRPMIQPSRQIGRGSSSNESRICLDSHTGTHVDAFLHFLDKADSISDMELERFLGPCRVLDLTSAEEFIGAVHLKEKKIEEGDIILLKTRNSSIYSDRFNPGFIYLNREGAVYLSERKIKSVGIDYLGIERDQPSHDTHRILFQNRIPIIEGLNLEHVPEGDYFISCLPLNLTGLDASPARAVLFRI